MIHKQKIIIDTDIGDDIDDAIALYTAMHQEFEIIGVTTVFRNTIDRARQAKKLMKAYGHGYEHVPVYAGYGEALDARPRAWDHIPHYTPDLEADEYAPDGTNPEDAVDFIIASCKKYQKDLTVVAIGAFTNIAHVIRKDPEALRLVSSVTIMGGAYLKQYADWNVTCDVNAADIMFCSLDHLKCIGADVTHLMIGEEALYDNLLNYQGSEPGHLYLTTLCHLWRGNRATAPLLLHDPLVIYYLADPALCHMQSASIIVLTDGYAKGLTLNVNAYGKKRYHPDIYANFDENHKAEIAVSAQQDAFNAAILRDCQV